MAETKTNTIIRSILEKNPIPETIIPSEFISKYWNCYEENHKSNNALNGSVFEALIIIALARENINNIYYQTELSFVPSAIFDIFLYHPETPIALSAKTSLRERWKQADLEAYALKNVHKGAKSFVITLSEVEVKAREKNDNTYAGLDGFILANSKKFDELINDIKKIDFSIAGHVPIIQSSEKKYDNKKFENDFGLIL